MKKLQILVTGAFSMIAAVAVAAPAPAPAPANVAGPAGVHINAVTVRGACGMQASFSVELQNNMPGKNAIAHLGNVNVNQSGNTSAYATSEFRNLAAGARRTVNVNSNWTITCAADKKKQPQCFDIGLLMEPDGTANGEVWDGVKHKVCGPTTKTPGKSDAPFTDTEIGK